MNNARDLHGNKHKWGKIGPSYLLSENGDVSFFFETMPGGEHSGKVSKKFIGNFFFWGVPLNVCAFQPKIMLPTTAHVLDLPLTMLVQFSIILYLSIYSRS